MPKWITTIACCALLLAACGRQIPGGGGPASAPPAVQHIALSHGLSSDYSPLAETDHFASQETFYGAVQFGGLRPGVVVSARWLYGDQLIKRTDYVVQQNGNGWVGFELSNDHPPWPAGEYHLEILVDHTRVGSADFRVTP
jgi:hypothetical protein